MLAVGQITLQSQDKRHRQNRPNLRRRCPSRYRADVPDLAGGMRLVR
jgi:hypothetical protein